MSDEIKIGNRVLCVDASPYPSGAVPNLKEGREYIVYNKIVCEKCGAAELDVGDVFTGRYGMLCSNCNRDFPISLIGNIWFHGVKRFVKSKRESEKKEESIFITLTPKKVIEQQPTIAKDRKSTRLNSSHIQKSRMPSSA